MNFLPKILILFWAFGVSKSLYAQTYPSFRNYSVEKGLPSSITYDILQDRKGYIWIAGELGVSRFDGYTFTNYSPANGLPDNTIFYLYEDNKGRIWFLPSNGRLSYFFDEKVHEYPYNSRLISEIGNRPVFASFHADSSDNLLLSTSEVTIRINGRGDLTRIGQEENIHISKLASGEYFIGEKVSYRHRATFRVQAEGTDSSYTFPNVLLYFNNRVCLTPSGLLFTSQNTIYCFRNGHVRVRVMPFNIIYCFTDSGNNLWVGTTKSGLYFYPGGDLDAEPKIYLPGKSISSITQDKDGSLWFCTLEDGVYYLPFAGMFIYPDLSGNNIISLANQKDRILYALTLSGILYAVEQDRSEVVPLDFGVKGYYVSDLFYDSISGALCLGNDFYRDGKLMNSGLRGEFSVKDICGQSKEGVWTLYHNFLVLYSPPPVQKALKTIKLPFRALSVYVDELQTIWLGTHEGLWRMRNEKLEYLGERHALLKSRIADITSSSRGLLMATRNSGLLMIRFDRDDQIKIQTLDVNDGLSSNNIEHIYTENGRWYLSTNNGLNQVIWTDEGKPLIYVLKESDGLPSDEVSHSLRFQDRIIVATRKGLASFNPAAGLSQASAPVYISKVSITDKDTQVLSYYHLLPWQNSLAFDFVSLSYRHSDKLDYYYQLAGLDNMWHSTDSRRVIFRNLPAGRYLFKVMVKNPGGVWSSSVAQLQFEIALPFWKETWFILTVSLSFCLAAFLIIRGIINNIRQTGRIKEEVMVYKHQALSAQMNPHFIFNSLSAVQHYILKNEKKEANKYLSKFSSLMRQVLNNSAESHVILANELDSLRTYLELEQLRFSGLFEYVIRLDPSFDARLLSVPALLIQPFVENSIRHGLIHKGEKGLIEIELRMEGYQLECSIRDNGIGRTLSNHLQGNDSLKNRSYGMKITEKRLELLSRLKKEPMRYEVRDLVNDLGEPCGTEVMFSIPYKLNSHD